MKNLCDVQYLVINVIANTENYYLDKIKNQQLKQALFMALICNKGRGILELST